jgi:Zn-dependent protease
MENEQERLERRRRNLNLVAAQMAKNPVGYDVPEAPRPTEAPSRGLGAHLRRWGPVGAGLAFLLGKLKILLPVLKFLKMGTALSMLLAVWVYATIWGLPFALGFVLLIFVHEMGHAVALKRLGIPSGAPVFIPFVGAVIAMKGMPRNAYLEAVVGIGGPALGTAGAALCLLVAHATGEPFWYALASTGFLINLFNMIPISPLDGGRIVGVISRWLWAAGYVVGAGVFWVTRSPILLLILILGLFSLKRTVRGPREDYYDVPAALRVRMGVYYFGLMALMALGMWAAEAPLAHLTAQG